MEKARTLYIVDDDADDRMFIREAIEETVGEVHIIEIPDGKELLDLLAVQDPSGYPSVIILDMNMPRLNGLDTLKLIKANPCCAHIPVLILSTTSNPQLIGQAYTEAASAFLIKPQTSEEFALASQAVASCFLDRYPSSQRDLPRILSVRAKSVLLIEQDPEQLDLIKLTANKNMPGLKIVGFTNACTTLAFLEREWCSLKVKPQMVLLNLYLPEREDGLRLLEGISNFFQTRRVYLPIIVYSSSDCDEDLKASYIRKANCYLKKPSDINQWQSFIKDLLRTWSGPITLPRFSVFG